MTYIDVLPVIVHAYNNSPHRGLGDGQTPAQINKVKNTEDILSQFKIMCLNDDSLRGSVSRRLAVGDTVRLQNISRTRFQFHKGYKVNNTEEILKEKKMILQIKILLIPTGSRRG